jgi:putative ABC transport system ATP-binding protein
VTGEVLLRCRDLSVVHEGDGEPVHAVDGVSLEVRASERLALTGRSGSGKTTLLHALGGLLEPTSGSVERRGSTPAFVFQGSNLLPHFNAFENVAFASHVAAGTARPLELLALVGLADKAEHLPAELSGGEQQRVAFARALAQEPDVMLCDEPTGHLDSDTGERVLDLLDALQEELGFAVVVSTHDGEVAARFGRIVFLHDGRATSSEVAA